MKMFENKNYEQVWKSEEGNVRIFLDLFDHERKWLIYRQMVYNDEPTNIRAEFVNSFETFDKAFMYAKRIDDVLIVR